MTRNSWKEPELAMVIVSLMPEVFVSVSVVPLMLAVRSDGVRRSSSCSSRGRSRGRSRARRAPLEPGGAGAKRRCHSDFNMFRTSTMVGGDYLLSVGRISSQDVRVRSGPTAKKSCRVRYLQFLFRFVRACGRG